MKTIRTRFAPSPTGIMHIGNIRAALLNYMFAKQHQGVFVLRIEDTDLKRNFDIGAQHIQKHLAWLHLSPNEGPAIGGPHAPYFQSERTHIYKKYLESLINSDHVYRCFCTPDELEQRRQRQIALKKPPRYDGPCRSLSQSTIEQKVQAGNSFVWRVKIDQSQKIQFTDLARGVLTFDLKNFSDFPITREDSSFTFVFANCIDDIEMQMSHVFRGEDHLTNTVSQIVLLHALHKPLPIFWHLPIMCNKDGKKLSKRDKGFSLEDLISAGFLPEAICNYLGIIGGSFEQEILSLDELTKVYQFDNVHSTSQVRYDLEKLTWVNHKWITRYPLASLTQLCKPILTEQYGKLSLSDATLEQLIAIVRNDMHTLHDVCNLLKFYFVKPHITHEELEAVIPQKTESLQKILAAKHDSFQEFSNYISAQAKMHGITPKELFSSVRLLLTGSITGMQIKDLFEMLGREEFFKRLRKD